MVPPILAEQCELKHSLVNMMTSDQFFGLEKDNPHDHIRWFNKITSTIKYKDVPNSAIKLMLFPFSLAGAAHRTTNLCNEILNFQQRFDESFHEAWDKYKDLIRACPHHGFTELHQLDTFYNALNLADQDSLNAAAGGNLLERRTQDVLTIIENKSKQTSDVTTAITTILKQFQATPPPASVKAIEEICVTCGGAHPYYQCLAAGGNTFPELRDNIQGYVYNQGNSVYRPPGSGSLPSNTIVKPKGELKAITTRSGIVLDGPSVPTPPLFINPKEDERVEETLTDQDLAEYTIKVPPPLVQKSKPLSQRVFVVHQRDPLYPNISYPSRMLKQKQQEKDEVQIHKFWKMFKQLHINITLVDALILILKYQKMLKALLSNKEKLQELANTPLNENCSAVILKKLPKKLRDPWEISHYKLGLPEVISTRMTLELANRAICTPAGIARDVFVPTARALIDVHEEKMILRDEGGNVLPEKWLDLDSTKDLHPPLHFDIESDLKEIEYLLHHDPIKDIDSILKDSTDKSNLANLNNNLVDSMLEMFTNEHALDYSSPLLYDEYDDGLFKVESDTKNYDSFLSEDFSEVDSLPSTNNEDKVFNPGILIQENLFEIITRVAQDKKLAISHASLTIEDFDHPLYELPFFKDVPRSKILLPFSFKNEEKVFKPGIHTSEKVHSSLITELSYQDIPGFRRLMLKDFVLQSSFPQLY
nr:reverse transcriptase domain-containing protein [Tanacetum cinerariifolium]